MNKTGFILLATVFLIASSGISAVYAAKKCTQIVIKSTNEVRSDFITFFKLNKSRPVKDHSLEVDKIKYPLILEECGVRQFYIHRQPGKVFLVKKSKFQCIKFDEVASDRMTAGLPGSGSANVDCGE